MRAFRLLAPLMLALAAASLAASPAYADKVSDRARQMDAAQESFLLGTWTFSKADAIGSRTLYIRFDKKGVASIKVSGDSNILPGPLTANGVFWKVNSITETAFFLEIGADQLIGGGMHDMKRRPDDTLIDGDGTVWTRLP